MSESNVHISIMAQKVGDNSAFVTSAKRALLYLLLRLCTYQCKSLGGGGGVRARGGDLMSETIPLSGF